MSKLKELPVSNCEKKFIKKALSEWNRLDGRAFEEFRELKIEFGKDWGCCTVALGDTRVLAQVSCEVQQPKASRPSEGILNINLELTPLGAPNFEAGRQSELSVQLNRLLEKGLKDSKAVDLESLCIKVNEKVWMFRVDVNVLNHEGNILDAASIAALAALSHFRRPDVTFDGEEFIIHTYAQKDPIPTVIHHYPVCISYAVFENGEIILADPNLLEENVSDAQFTIGLNGYKEVCGMHLGGSAAMNIDTILKTSQSAARRAKTIIEEIKKYVEEDSTKRLNKEPVGLLLNLDIQNESSTDAHNKLSLCLDKWNKVKRKKKKVPAEIHELCGSIESLGKNSMALLPQETQGNEWIPSSDEEMDIIPGESDKQKHKGDIKMEGDSEEEEVLILNTTEQVKKRQKTRKED
ncbi:exosome complex exonuclease ribosomal rna processing protein [Holotrichia oblita]|uniref:Exosome complex exonuclease ribosomal rna processing protein n=1 Tax=Holotrichia oblita TaxID=644536 RepID=A0ACB9T773_HOLOL|nr:exosome complex exonuclease ribosomal rna processing protein [Holotrichia oblita]